MPAIGGIVMMENVIVCALVGAALIFAGRSFYRSLTGRNDGCGCGTKSCSTSDRCHSAEKDKEVQAKGSN